MIKLRVIAAAAGCLVFSPVVIAWVRRRKGMKVPERAGAWLMWLWQAAAMLYGMYASRKWFRGGEGRVREWTGALHPGMRSDRYVVRHGISRTAAGYSVALLTALCVNLYLLQDLSCDMPGAQLERAPAEGAARQVDIVARVADEDVPFHLTVNARGYTGQELKEKMAVAKDHLKNCLPGENEDLLHVQTALCFEKSIPELPFTVEWQPADYQLIGQDGSLGDIPASLLPAQTRVTAVIRYRDITETADFTVRITGIKKSAREELLQQVTEAVAAADEASAEQTYLTLPDHVDGRPAAWRYAGDHGVLWVIFTGILLAFFMVRMQDEHLKKEVKARSEAVRYDYPGFVHQMVLFLGAGMTVRRSWDLMIEDFEKNGAGGCRDSYLYREMLYARRQMQMGISETEVYRAFGERMPYPGYTGLCRLLVQLIRTGSSGMREMMMKEAQDAEKHRRDMARKLGETAGTKLLLPMMLLLSVVFAVIMLPAFLSM